MSTDPMDYLGVAPIAGQNLHTETLKCLNLALKDTGLGLEWLSAQIRLEIDSQVKRSVSSIIKGMAISRLMAMDGMLTEAVSLSRKENKSDK